MIGVPSAQVQSQSHGQDNGGQDEERQPGLQEASAADVLSVDEGKQANVDHVP